MRSLKKLPVINIKLVTKIIQMKNSSVLGTSPIRVWSRCCTILPIFIGFTFMVHNGRIFRPIKVDERMVGHKFGEFVMTRTFVRHKLSKKKQVRRYSKKVK